MIHRTVNELRPFLDSRGQQIDLHIHEDSATAEVDPSKIGDILTNLIANAIKFTPDDGGITVTAMPIEDDFVRMEVSDSGRGIHVDDQTHLFEPFFTGYNTKNHSSGDFQYGKRGIGLGLCLVKSFVELHGGTVDVHSDGVTGSTFGFTLPRVQTSTAVIRAVG